MPAQPALKLQEFTAWARRLAWAPLRFALNQELGAAILLGQTERAQAALERGASVEDIASGFDLPPLHLAAGEGSASLCALLLRHGASLEGRDRHGERPLSHAISARDCEECVVFLLKSGACANRLPPEGQAPLERAVEHGSLEAVRALLRAGALPNGDPLGGAPLISALRRKDQEIAHALLDAGADSAVGISWALEAGLSAQAAWLEARALERSMGKSSALAARKPLAL